MASEKVSITIGDEIFDAYVSLPPKGSGPGVLLIQEIFGVNQHIRDVAERLAQEGFVVMAPDLFWRLKHNIQLGYEGAEFEQALKYFEMFDETKGLADLKEAATNLRDHKKCTGRVGAMGFCLGGKLAYRLASQFNLNASICYYPVALEQHLEEAERIRCEIAIHFAGLDHFVPKASAEKIETGPCEPTELSYIPVRGGRSWLQLRCPVLYNKEAAALAWSRSVEILTKELMG